MKPLKAIREITAGVRRALLFAGLGAACLLFALCHAENALPFNVADYFTSAAAKDRARAERLRDEAALMDARTRARIDTERFEADAEFRRFVLEQARKNDALLEKFSFQAGVYQQKSTLWASAAGLLGAAAAGLFLIAKKYSRKAAKAEHALTEVQHRLSEAIHSGAISPAAAHRIMTGERLLMALK